LSFTANEQILFAGTENGVFRSTDNGSIWTATGGGLTNPYVYSIYYDSTILFAGTGAGVFRSTDLGETWDTSSTGLPFGSVFSFLKWNDMFLIGTSAGVYRSSDNGMTWEGPSSGMDYGYVGDFTTSGNNIFVILAGLSYGSVYRSTDDGASWTLVSSSFPQTGYVNALISYNSEVFASVGGKVLYSTDLGITWTDMSEGLQNHLVTALVTDGTEIYLAAYTSWMWRRSLSEVLAVEDDQLNPNNFSLKQNYPNPFNPSTSIQYAIGSTQFVSLKVYDVLGNEVASLVNEEQQAGEHSVNFEASRISSGVYFYRLETGKFSETKSMILIK
jgi:photosystem II stability/assembly factor-like uncharacterized protein